MSEFAIQVKHLDKMYKLYNKPSDRLKEALGMKVPVREHYALRDVSFDVKRGETVGIIGTNGSGKSTFLKAIAGILKPYKGKIKVRGNIAPMIELGAGFDGELTARENIYMNGTLLGHSKEFMDEHFDEIVEFANIKKFLDSPIKNYSSGMKSRLGFSVATLVEPDILILDEVLSVGDAKFRKKSEAKIMSMFDKGVTVLFVSHSLDQVKRLCNKAILLEKGQIISRGSIEEVSKVYEEKTK